MKKLTLQINERQEEEDMNEAIAAVRPPNLHRNEKKLQNIFLTDATTWFGDIPGERKLSSEAHERLPPQGRPRR